MKHYLKLVNFELNRFMKLYGLLLLVILLIQTVSTVIAVKYFMSMMTDVVTNGDMEGFDKFGLIDVTYSLGFIAPIVIGVAALLFYLFFIWYRDWFARNAFIYRLLTLPTSRMSVYFAKLTTIMITVLGLVAYQLVVLSFLNMLIKMLVPITYRQDVTIIDAVISSPYLSVFTPDGIAAFLVAYAIGLSSVIVVFTMILLERSFRLKGLVLGVVYLGFCFLVILLPVLVQTALGNYYLYDSEMFFLEAFMLFLVVVASLWLSKYLINHKITV